VDSLPRADERLPGSGHATAMEVLESLKREAEALAEGKIDWYRRKKEAKKRLSQWLRAVAIVVAVAGGVCPLVGGIVGGLEFVKLGYVLLAVAGGFVLFDTLFGVSSSWMRYMSSAQRIERVRDSFRLEWAGRMAIASSGGGDDSQIELLALLTRFVDDVHAIIREETDRWVGEFQGNVARLERSIRSSGGMER
jgi:hypothetical protein